MRWLPVLLLPLLLGGQSIDPAAIDSIVERTRAEWQAPGIAIAIVKGDAVVHLKGYGVKRLGEPAAVTPDTRFAIGSTTKAFTTTAMAILVDRGKIDWDDPVRKHYSEFRLSDPLANENVTLRDIVSHRTGLSRHDPLWYGTSWTRDEIIQRIGLVALAKPFRQNYQYQNIMFSTAGQVVARASGGTWETFVQENLLKPLGMANTDFSARDVLKAPDYSAPHVKRKTGVATVPWRNLDNIGPAGSINSSARDLAQWVRMHLNHGQLNGKRIVSEKELDETQSAQMVIRDEGASSRELNPETNVSVYGLGWRLQDYRGHHLVSHGGAIDGFRAQVALVPKQNLGLVILSNLGTNNLPEALRFALLDQLLGLPAKDWNTLYLSTARKVEADQKKQLAEREQKRHKDTKPSRELAGYAGSYRNPAYGSAQISVDGNGLLLRWMHWSLKLNHFHFDTFQSPDDETSAANTQVIFTLNAAGDVSALKFLDQNFVRGNQ